MTPSIKRPRLLPVVLASLGWLAPEVSTYGFDYVNLSVQSTLTAGSTGSFLWNNYGTFISSESSLSGGYPASSASSLFWMPSTGVFFAGEWPGAASMGANSVGFGTSSAPGAYGFAAGYGATAAGPYSIAMGCSALTQGESSVALGSAFTVGWYAVALGAAFAEGDGSFAAGYGMASGAGSVSAGGGWAMGNYSATLGYSTVAKAMGCVAIGQYNLGLGATGAETTWNPADPIFEIGIGSGLASDPNQYSNALTVLKNGNATFKGVVRVAPGGDIPMF